MSKVQWKKQLVLYNQVTDISMISKVSKHIKLWQCLLPIIYITVPKKNSGREVSNNNPSCGFYPTVSPPIHFNCGQLEGSTGGKRDREEERRATKVESNYSPGQILYFNF